MIEAKKLKIICLISYTKTIKVGRKKGRLVRRMPGKNNPNARTANPTGPIDEKGLTTRPNNGKKIILTLHPSNRPRPAMDYQKASIDLVVQPQRDSKQKKALVRHNTFMAEVK